MTRHAALLPPICLLMLAGCVRDPGVYPSLAPRPTEKLGFAEPERATPAPDTPDPQLDAKLAELNGRLATIGQGFDAALAKARIAAERPAARKVGSDAWIDAQTALAGLDDWRAQASAVAADASDLGAARAQALAPDYPALTRLQATAEAETSRLGAAIAGLQAALPGA